MMLATLILTILNCNRCYSFVFKPISMENSVEENALEYDSEPSTNVVSQDFMEQKTENELDDKVLFYEQFVSNFNRIFKMEKETASASSFPYFVVLSQSGKKTPKHQRPSLSLTKRQGGLIQTISEVVSNTRLE